MRSSPAGSRASRSRSARRRPRRRSTLLAGDRRLLVGAGTVLTPGAGRPRGRRGRSVHRFARASTSRSSAAAARGVAGHPGIATADGGDGRPARRTSTPSSSSRPRPSAGSACCTALAAPFPGLRFIPTGGIGSAELPAIPAGHRCRTRGRRQLDDAAGAAHRRPVRRDRRAGGGSRRSCRRRARRRRRRMTRDFRPASSARFDLVALGEVMLRLDPGEGRVRTARQLPRLGRRRRVQRRARAAPLLRAAHRRRHRAVRQRRRTADRGPHARRAGSTPMPRAGRPSTASARATRNGLNFTERGFGVRGARRRVRPRPHRGEPDGAGGRRLGRAVRRRSGCAASTPAASSRRSHQSTAALAEEAMRAARPHGTGVSYDLNYRASLWKALGGIRRAARGGQPRLAPLVDVMIGNEEDFTACARIRGRRRRRATSMLRSGELPGR